MYEVLGWIFDPAEEFLLSFSIVFQIFMVSNSCIIIFTAFSFSGSPH
jgi:hypothetical protein